MDGKNLEKILHDALVGSREVMIILNENVENISFITPLWAMNYFGKISLKNPDIMATVTSRPWVKEKNRTFKFTLTKKFDKAMDSFVDQMYLGIKEIAVIGQTPAAEQK